MIEAQRPADSLRETTLPANPAMSDQSTAILRLLGDEDPETVAMVKRKLEEVSTLSSLAELRAAAEGRAAAHLDELMARRRQSDADAKFTALCQSFPEMGDVEEASWLFAAALRPEADFSEARQRLDEWGARLQQHLQGISGAEEKVTALAEFMTRDVRLRGNEGDYYNIENSLLPRVIESRRGIPITMALVYQLVAKRAGLSIDGVGLPGHFVARHEAVFFDPFHGGKRIGLEECAALLEQQNLVLTPQHLMPTTPRQMLIRMLTNVYYIGERNDPALAAKVEGWIGVLREHHP